MRKGTVWIMWVAALAGCSGSGGSSGGAGSVGPEGGTLVYEDVEIDVEPGAIDTPTGFTVTRDSTAVPLPTGIQEVGLGFTISPTGDPDFEMPIEVTLCYDEALAGNEDFLTVLHLDAAQQEWEPTHVIELDTSANKISFLSRDFSLFYVTNMENVQLPQMVSLQNSAGDHFNFDNMWVPPIRSRSAEYLTPGGTCLGLASYCAWFFRHRPTEKLKIKYPPDEADKLARRAHVAQSNDWLEILYTDWDGWEDAQVIHHIKCILAVLDWPVIVLLGESGNPFARPFQHAGVIYGYVETNPATNSGEFLLYEVGREANAVPSKIEYVNGEFLDYTPWSGFTVDNVYYTTLPALGQKDEFQSLYDAAASDYRGGNALALQSVSEHTLDSGSEPNEFAIVVSIDDLETTRHPVHDGIVVDLAYEILEPLAKQGLLYVNGQIPHFYGERSRLPHAEAIGNTMTFQDIFLREGSNEVILLAGEERRNSFADSWCLNVGIEVVVAFDPPENLDVQVDTDGLASLTWTDPSTDEESYEVSRKLASESSFLIIGSSLAVDTESFDDPDPLPPGTTVSYRVRYHTPAGPSDYAEATVQVPDYLLAPDNLYASNPGGHVLAVELTWADHATNETGFEIERREPGGIFQPVGTAPAAAQTSQDTGMQVQYLDTHDLQGSTDYVYRVRAVNASEQSAYSMEFTVHTIPEAPSNLQVSAVPNGQAAMVTLTWMDNSDDESNFDIERRVGSGSWMSIQTPPADAQSASFSEPSGLQISYRIYAQNNMGILVSEYSNTVTITTP